MESTRLNVFQRLTLHWDSIHPYNAAQLMSLDGPADEQRLRETWRCTVRELGVDSLRVDGKSVRWDTVPRRYEQLDLSIVAPGASLNELMTEELNRRFDARRDPPFRAYAWNHDSGHYAGIVYHHWAADSYSIRMLLREWFLRLHNPSAARRAPLRLATQGYWKRFGPERARWRLVGAALDMVRWNARFRRARRVDPHGQKDLSTHFNLYEAPAGLIDGILGVARAKGVTVNDVFLAAMAHVCDELVPMKRLPWRPDLALGTIVDLRSRGGRAMEDEFGLFLGFTSVFVRPRELANQDRLLQHISRESRRQKAAAAAESSMLRMVAGLVVDKLFNTPNLMEFYRKRAALTAGISNVNLNRDWPARYHPSPLKQYIRVSPVGPLLPVVFTPTTLGNQLNFGLTCRSSVIPPSQADALAEMFIAWLTRFAESRI